MADSPVRQDIKTLWDTLWADVDDDGVTGRDFLHFPKGSDTKDVVDWFKLVHAELDTHVENVVEISTQGLLRPRRHRYTASDVVVDADGVRTDGVERPELQGKRIVQIRWISGKGTVTSQAGASLDGNINGVRMHAVRFPGPEMDSAAPRI